MSEAYAAFDAERKFGVAEMRVEESSECLSGLVLQGKIKPHECPAFGTRCTPEHPLGATMVSSEGACAAYYRYRREPARLNCGLNRNEPKSEIRMPDPKEIRNPKSACVVGSGMSLL